MKYLAKEIVEKAGVDVSVIGTVAITIGGISVNEADHIIDMQDAEEVTVLIGTDEYTVELPEEDELEMSPALKEVVAEEVAVAEAQEEEAKVEEATE